MNYEQKYKEALERAREMYKQGMSTERLEYVFPELEKSKDEKIIDAIKHGLKYLGWEHVDGIRISDMVAWIEKLKGRYIVGVDMGISTGDKGCVVDFENANIPQKDFAPKIEPKFKVGDWVIYNSGNTYQVEEISDKRYELIDNFGDNLSVPMCWEKSLRLWTIQDAKDGDVICYKDEISLYKHDIKNCTKQETTFGGFVYYCCYDGKRFVIDSLYSLIEQDKMDIHPSTKEQRNILFQKMKEAGYEWNDEKKELKEIKLKTAELPKGEDNDIDGLYAAIDIMQKTLGKVEGYQTDDGILEHECAISAVKKLYEQKSAWSEEDEKMLDSIIDCIDGTGLLDFDQIDWLKSLKDRI